MKTLLVIFVLTLMLLLTGCSKKTKTIENSNKDITLTIYAHNGESESENIIYSLGHAWLSIENNKDSSLYFSNYEIKSGEALYFGSWGSSAKWGVCYNMEPQFASKYGRYDGTISLSIGIDEKQVDKLAEFALANDHWNIFQNCRFLLPHIHLLLAIFLLLFGLQKGFYVSTYLLPFLFPYFLTMLQILGAFFSLFFRYVFSIAKR